MKLIAFLVSLMCLNIASAFVFHCNYTTHPTYGYGCQGVVGECQEGLCKHEAGKDNKDVLFFMASNEELQSFPEKLAANFENLETVNLNFPKLMQIFNEDLKPFGSKLKNLLIVESQIEIVPENLFKNTPNIRHMVLNSNNISSIHKNAFEPLKNLNSFFFKLKCEGSEIDEDARNRAEVQEQIRNLEFQCYDRNVKDPLKSDSADKVEGYCVKCPKAPTTTTSEAPPITSSTSAAESTSTTEKTKIRDLHEIMEEVETKFMIGNDFTEYENNEFDFNATLIQLDGTSPTNDDVKFLMAFNFDVFPPEIAKSFPKVETLMIKSNLTSESIKSILENAFKPLKHLKLTFMRVTCDGKHFDIRAVNQEDFSSQIKNSAGECFDDFLSSTSLNEVDEKCKNKSFNWRQIIIITIEPFGAALLIVFIHFFNKEINKLMKSRTLPPSVELTTVKIRNSIEPKELNVDTLEAVLGRIFGIRKMRFVACIVGCILAGTFGIIFGNFWCETFGIVIGTIFGAILGALVVFVILLVIALFNHDPGSEVLSE